MLIWNSVAITNAAVANIVLGQPDLEANAPGCSEYIMNSPGGITVEGGRVLVSDSLNNRVLIWDSIPTLSNTAADMVLGQGLFNSCAARFPVDADTLKNPRGVWSDGTRLMVADTGNNRVLIWNTFPTIDGQPADLVVGQSSMAGFVANAGGLDAGSLNNPCYPGFTDKHVVSFFG